MNLTRIIANKNVTLKADRAYEYEANLVLDFIDESIEEIHHDSIVSFHYAFVAFKPLERGYQIVVPRLDGGGVDDYTDDLTYFLAVIRATFGLMQRIHLKGQLSNFHYRSQVIVANNAFTHPECYALRYDDNTWFIGPVDRSLPSQPLQKFEAHEVFSQHFEFYQVMHLPKDYIALFSNRQLCAVLDPTGVDLLAKKDEEGGIL